MIGRHIESNPAGVSRRYENHPRDAHNDSIRHVWISEPFGERKPGLATCSVLERKTAPISGSRIGSPVCLLDDNEVKGCAPLERAVTASSVGANSRATKEAR